MNIDNLCELLLETLAEAGFNESTLFNYRGVIRRFKTFCEEKGFSEYSTDVGQAYADDVISKKTGKFSKQRYFSQGRFARLLNSYYLTGSFDLSPMKRGMEHRPGNIPRHPLQCYENSPALLHRRTCA